MNPLHISLMILAVSGIAPAVEKIHMHILNGANNHGWKQTTPAIRAALEETA